MLVAYKEGNNAEIHNADNSNSQESKEDRISQLPDDVLKRIFDLSDLRIPRSHLYPAGLIN